jgi:hypothetical protein
VLDERLAMSPLEMSTTDPFEPPNSNKLSCQRWGLGDGRAIPA